MIIKTNQGYKVYSQTGKPLSKSFPTKQDAQKRLQQIKYYKNKK